MNDLVWMLSQLSTVDGTIQIPGLSEMVAPVTKEERALYDSIDFCMVPYPPGIC
jgi:Cys-Gly metallodipeptidase DUG1